MFFFVQSFMRIQFLFVYMHRAVDKDFCSWAFHPQILFLMGDLVLW